MSEQFTQARVNMVHNQLMPVGVTLYSVLSAFSQIERECFFPVDQQARAYIDRDSFLGDQTQTSSRFILAPSTFARLVQLADISPHEQILDIGIGLGYSTAILSLLGKSVVGVEFDESFCEEARHRLASFPSATVMSYQTCLETEALYDVLLFQGAVEAIPEELLAHVVDGGRVIVLEPRGAVCVAFLYWYQKGSLSGQGHFNCFAPTLTAFQKEAPFQL